MSLGIVVEDDYTSDFTRDEDGRGGGLVAWAVRAMLALYVLPVVALVMLLGGMFVAITGLARACARVGSALMTSGPTERLKRVVGPPAPHARGSKAGRMAATAGRRDQKSV